MKRIIALTAVGLDRPGIVAGVTEILYKLGCNLEESSMTRLHRDFAMILLISIPDSITLADLETQLQPAVQNLSLSFNLRPLEEAEIEDAEPERIPNSILSIYGIDKPGIVYRVSDLLAKHNINITDLETQITHNEEKPLYALILEIVVPETIKDTTLKSELKKLCTELDVYFSLKPVFSCEDM